jgi:hypothetical protein
MEPVDIPADVFKISHRCGGGELGHWVKKKMKKKI